MWREENVAKVAEKELRFFYCLKNVTEIQCRENSKIKISRKFKIVYYWKQLKTD